MLTTRHNLFSKHYHFSTKATRNDTTLHTIIRDCTSIKNINKFIKSTPIQVITKMALTTNDSGKIPIDELLVNKKLTDKDKIIIKNTLLEIIKRNQNIKPLAELLHTNTILNLRYSTANDQLIENLKLAGDIVNDVRRKIKYSSSHPDYNYYNKRMKVGIHNRIINGIRKFKFNDGFDSLKERNHVVTQLKSANCCEMSDEAILSLSEKVGSNYKVVDAWVRNGDHRFIVFSNMIEDRVDSRNAVFCDPWSGNIGKYNAEDVQKYLGDLRRMYINKNAPVNFITSINPEYHRISLGHEYDISPDICIKTKKSRLKLFDKQIKEFFKIEEKMLGRKLRWE